MKPLGMKPLEMNLGYLPFGLQPWQRAPCTVVPIHFQKTSSLTAAMSTMYWSKLMQNDDGEASCSDSSETFMLYPCGLSSVRVSEDFNCASIIQLSTAPEQSSMRMKGQRRQNLILMRLTGDVIAQLLVTPVNAVEQSNLLKLMSPALSRQLLGVSRPLHVAGIRWAILGSYTCVLHRAAGLVTLRLRPRARLCAFDFRVGRLDLDSSSEC